MNLSTSVTESAALRETERPSRTDVYCELAGMLREPYRLPAPESIRFDDNHPQWVYLHLSSTEDFDAWAVAFDAQVERREERCPTSVQSHAIAHWRGLIVSFNVCHLDDEPSTEQPEPTDLPEDVQLHDAGVEDETAPAAVEYEYAPSRLHGTGTPPHIRNAYVCADDCDNSPCPAGIEHARCVPGCLVPRTDAELILNELSSAAVATASDTPGGTPC